MIEEANLDSARQGPGQRWSEFWVRQYHGPRGPVEDAEERRKSSLLHAFTFVGMVSILFFGVQLVAKGNHQTALLDSATGILLGLNLLALRWHRRSLVASWVGLSVLGSYLLVQVVTGGDKDTGFLWTVLFPPAAAFLLGVRQGVLFLVAFLLALGWLAYGGDVFAGIGLPESFPTKLMGALILVSAFSFAFEAARERALKELTKAKELAERSAKLKGEFLANMSHEVRTPLNGIIGLTDLLLRADLPQPHHQHVQLAGDAARQLLELLNGILDLSKAEAGRLDLYPKPVVLRPLLNQIVSFYQPRVAAQGIGLTLEVDPGVPDGFLLDPLRVRQVLNNLLSNAVKFTNRGQITVRVGLEPDVQAQRLSLRFSVEDTGIGVLPEMVDTIFDDFVQADGSASRRFGGTGLGLAISKHLVERMGGRIGYQPRAGGGSVFWFRFLARPLEQVQAPDRKAVTPSANRGRALVVDDNPVNALVLRAMLQNLGFEVDEAGNGQAAVDRWSEGGLDLVLMDLQMPDMDGLEATEIIRSREVSPARIPIVAVTAHAMPGDRQRCMSSGMDDYLTKPVREADLAAIVERWLPAGDEPGEHGDAAPILDRTRLAISTRDDPALEATLRRMFLDNTPVLLDEMCQAKGAKEFAIVERLAHKLLGSCSTLGAQALGDASRQVELAVRSGDHERIGDLLDLVRVEFERIEAELLQMGSSGTSRLGGT